MANTKSAIKAARKSLRNAARNKTVKTRLKDDGRFWIDGDPYVSPYRRSVRASAPRPGVR